MAWLLDTNVLSEGRRPRPEPRVTAFFEQQPNEQLYLSVLSLAEIRYGIERHKDPEKRASLTDWLIQQVRPEFEGRILPITEDIMFRWRLLLEEGRKTGHTYSHPDLIIAATALHHGLTVVTRDRIDFDKAGVPVFNPWEP
jgi:predicted nucleic acid-binding protein